MRTRLPPLFSLQAFEAAARHGNFSRAATELHLTQGAVSRQIKQLETWSKLVLFERHGPRVQLTADGHQLLQRLQAPLDALHGAIYPSEALSQQTLHVCTLASIAKAWLLPRLPSFQAAHPSITLTVQTDYALVKLPPRLPMVAIRYGRVPDADTRSEWLFDDTLATVATASTAQRLGADPLAWPAEQLLRHTSGDWQVWWEAVGLTPTAPAAGYAFNDADVMLDAAEQGLGIALSRLTLARPRLEQGRLIQAHGTHCPSGLRHYLLYRADCAELPAVRAFTEWMIEQAAQWRESLAQARDRPKS